MVEMVASERCPDCGTALSDEPWAVGLCLQCLARLAIDAPGPVELATSAEDQPTLAYSGDGLVAGQVLGNRYRVSALLGRGGMGEVWRAYDLKLRVDVALKALRPTLLSEERAVEALRQEVRAAREVISPNVCRVFDLIELDGRELVSMEYIDGVTLADILKMRAPLDLIEAREIASQFLAGLEAIHAANLVHRDVKPENIMMTRSGRLVMMDFGIAKGLAEGRSGTVAGTPAYMAPEQARGEGVDARADVFSAGVVLAEMIAPQGLATHEARAAIWEGIHREPPLLLESAWGAVLRRAVSRRPEERHATAAELIRALEEVTLRVEGADQLRPYPGLASFTPEDAEYFFGRELEVEEMWKKMRRPHLMGLIGPSGAGKSSFIGAGLLPVAPTGWRVVVTIPSDQPFTALSQALVSELSGDEEALKRLLQFRDLDVAVEVVGQWRQRHDQALIVVDQFEELFTQNPIETQQHFAELLGRLAIDADVHVLLSMRDDFLFHCQRLEPLKPLFSELTPLGPLSGGGLRRALVQPALKCGYTFEDEAMVDEMIAAVGQERGALPMLAFAASRLWELRDRDSGGLTREGYERIGGVGGALAQHAEQTLERVGQDRVTIVREIFRNLVTAQGTRLARDREELLSVFGDSLAADREEAGRVLDSLVDARLLTSYESRGMDEEASARHRIEIVHESLLSNWPRLVHWQAQDEEGALLRDQLRQAARMWEERGKPEDLLWTGTSLKEYELWRERYSGGISASEEAFTAAMVDKAERHRRRKRLILAAVIVVLALGLSVVAGLWWQAEVSRRQAEAETRRAEASKLLALAQIELDAFPTGALAYVRRSLRLADTPEARRFALDVLWRGPVARILPDARAFRVVMSPDGEWLALGSSQIELIAADGRRSDPIGRSVQGNDLYRATLGFAAGGEILFRGPVRVREKDSELRVLERWTFPDLGELPELRWYEEVGFDPPTEIGLPIYTGLDRERGTFDLSLLPVSSYRAAEPQLRALGRWSAPGGTWVDPTGTRMLWVSGRELLVRPLEGREASQERRLGESAGAVSHFFFSPDGTLVASSERDSERMYVWSVEGTSRRPLLELAGNRNPDPLSFPSFSHDNRRLVMASTSDRSVRVWDLETPLDGRPLVLQKQDGSDGYRGVFHPSGRWLATLHGLNVALWPMDWPYARRLSPQEDTGFAWLRAIAFSPDSRWLASCSGWSGIHLWPLETGVGGERSIANRCLALAFDPSGGELLTGGNGFAAVGPVDAEDPRLLVESEGWFQSVAFDPAGRRVAASPNQFLSRPEAGRLWVWDLESEESWILDLFDGCVSASQRDEPDCLILGMGFAADGSLWFGGYGGVRRWDLDRDEVEWSLGPDPDLITKVSLSRDGRYMLQLANTMNSDGELERENLRPGVGKLRWLDLVTEKEVVLQGWPTGEARALALDATGQIAAVSTVGGDVWVGRVEGGEPHRLVGHESTAYAVVFSPDGRWIASAGERDVLLWPMPDLDRQPLHTLPLEELLSKMDTMTNVRAIENPDAATGWALEVGTFPGWRDTPTW